MKSPRITLHNIYGFSLIETLVGLAILAIVSIGMYCAFFTVVDLQTESRDEAAANALAQGLLEEIRSQADVDFDSLGKVIDDDDRITYNPAVVQDEVPGFAGYSSEQRVEEINHGLKRAQAKVSWSNEAGTEEILLATLIARPSELLPGNIHGKVIDPDGNGIDKAEVIAAQIGGSQSFKTVTASDGYYTFETTAGYQFSPGDWKVSATKSDSYYDSDTTASSVTCTVPAGLDVLADPIVLTPLPGPGNILCTVKDRSTNLPIRGIEVDLYREGRKEAHGSTNSKGEELFDELTPYNYTVATRDTYEEGYTCFFGETEPYPNKPYPTDGWSTAMEGATWPISSAELRNLWSGPPDNIVVESETTTKVDILLDPIPKGTVTGIVYKDDNGDGKADGVITDGSVRIWWYGVMYSNKGGHIATRWTKSHYLIAEVATNNNGRYAADVYIPYFVFSDTPNAWNAIEADAPGYEPAGPSASLSSADIKIGGTYNNQVYLEHNKTNGDVNFLLVLSQPSPAPGPDEPLEEKEYGNVEGYVTDTDRGSPLDNVKVKIGGRSDYTDGKGYYFIGDISTGAHTVTGTRSSYKSYDSWDDERRKVSVVADTTVRFDFKMEGVGWGNIKGRVTSLVTGDGIAGATITLTVYSGAPAGSPASVQTGGDGSYDFATKGNPYPIVETGGSEKLHTLSASAGGYVAMTQKNVAVSEAATTTVNFQLAIDDSGL